MVEIGGTWLAASAQRTPVNTEAKLLMFAHAFETWDVHAVMLCTDRRNARSAGPLRGWGAPSTACCGPIGRVRTGPLRPADFSLLAEMAGGKAAIVGPPGCRLTG